ncbi:MAG: type II toxin-antitoxin system VapC family toxin [Chloroflexota bacterium]|nr:type II toxin-antitoxin system VapC family toxin [Chloroflexota bacterium]
MDKAVVIDASVWVSRLLPHDLHHNASRLWVEQYKSKGGLFIAPSLLVIEVAASVSRQTGAAALAKEAARNLYTIHGIRIVPLKAHLVWTASQVAADLRLRTGDATYVAVADQLSIPLISWDKEQRQKAAERVPTYTPDSYVF